MKRIAASAFLAVMGSAFLFASGVENKTNMSTGYLRNPSRNTEAKRPEASYYNIAGTAFMKNGLHIEAGNQFVFKEYGNELNTGNALSIYGISDYYSNDETTVWLYPDADFVYKHDKFAIFGNFGVYAGGGSLEYSEGTSATTLLFAGAAKKNLAAGQNETAQKFLGAAKNHSLKVTSITYGGQLGGAYKFLDNLSFAAGLRYVHGTQTMSIKSNYFSGLRNGSNEISYKANGYTVSGVFGIHWQPIEVVDLAVQYQSKSSVKYKVTDVDGNLAEKFNIENGKTFHTDLPAALNLGAGWQALENLYLSTSFNYYFNTFADQNSILGETDYANSWEIALGADWKICKWLSYSAGIQYGKQGTKDGSNSTFNPVLDSVCFGTGVEIYPTEELTLAFSGLFAKYFDTDYYLQDTYKTTLSKKVTNLSFGVTYHFPNL
ncbi:MAG: outer membrane protein transport protein [Treponema sp.]|uniref:OmpP1/FadL family transporter n=1 Tax=Treponema sp. TaxID=166 RepID=UPI0025D93138|nr:outer membrane protein transport protein [Treponema sp.]MBQ8678870.1 outer membrane protein transport protein [Treponema sp.]